MQPQRSTQISPNTLLALQNLCENGKEEQPIVMLNLLRFSPLAKYGTAKGLQPPKGVTTGREAFQHYSKLMSPLLQRIGAALVFAAPAQLTMIAPDGEGWDQCLMVRYPSAKIFLEMIRSDEYRKHMLPHRLAALHDSRLILLQENQLKAVKAKL